MFAMARTLSLFLLTLLALFSGMGKAGAGPKDVFSVSGIAVTVEGDPQTARDRAYAEGQPVAWQKLIEQIAGNGQSLPAPDPVLLASWVRDFDVEQEKVSPSRYSGRFTYRFAADPVRAYLQAHHVAFAELATRPFLVIPVFINAEGAALLWEKQNFWANAWHNQPQGLTPVIAPVGSIEDTQNVTTAQATNGDVTALQNMAARYNAQGALVAIATLTGSEQTGYGLNIRTVRYSNGPPVIASLEIPEGTANLDELMRNGAEQVRSQLGETWRAANLTDSSETHTITVRIALNDLAGWADLQRRLGGIPAIQEKHLESFSQREAILVLTHAGTPEQFGRALDNAGLTIITSTSGGLVLGPNPGWKAPLGTPKNLTPPTSSPAPTPLP